MPAWEEIALGALATALACVVGLALVEQPREARRIVLGGLAALAGPLGWNAVLRITGDDVLGRELAAAAFPASWSDVGVAITTFSAVALVLGLGPDRRAAAARVLTAASGCAVAAFGISVYVT